MIRDPGAWFRQTKAVYLDNATSTRDYRVQLRGNRSVLLFGIYLLTLIGVAMVVYVNTARVGLVEVVAAQRQLREFYGIVMALLAGLVALIAPALTATTVVTERQRRSLDLVFSAPVTPKYFLVGKMISSFRYTWMLLVLALPVTATCIVLGGASWSDVLIAYLLLSLQGLMMTAIALLMSTLAQKPVSAVLWSYTANIVFLIFTASLDSMTMARSFMGGSRSQEAPFFSTLNPFLIQFTSATYTTIGTYQIPNWVFTILIAGLVCKVCLLAAGSLLSPNPTKEIASLRLHALAYYGGMLFYGAWEAASAPTYTILQAGRAVFMAMLPLFICLPFLSTFGVDAERKYWPNGALSWRKVLDGTPAGGLPFLWLFIGANALLVWLGFYLSAKITLGTDYAIWVFFTLAFWTFFWAVGRYGSSLFIGLRAARTIQFAAFVLVVVVPVPFLSSLTSANPSDSVPSLWDFYVLRPMIVDSTPTSTSALVWGGLLAVLAVVISVFASLNTKRKMELLQNRYEGILGSA